MPANQPRVAQPDHMEAGGAGMGGGGETDPLRALQIGEEQRTQGREPRIGRRRSTLCPFCPGNTAWSDRSGDLSRLGGYSPRKSAISSVLV